MSEVDWNSDTFLVWARRAACPTEGATAMGRHLRISRQAVYRALALLQKEGLL